MPFADINLVSLKYEILGNVGPWAALVPGARRSMEEIRGLATLTAAAGFRVLLHDRRNTGESGLSIGVDGSEFKIWAEDLCALLKRLNATPAIVGGSSSGCRVSTILTLRHPEMVTALLMMRITGGAFAVKRLSNVYYTLYIEAAERGGMNAVCETEHFKGLIAQKPARREQIMSWDARRFIDVMVRWRTSLESSIGHPMLGASIQDLHSIDVPTCIIPGNDKTHSLAVARHVHSLVPHSEIHELRSDQLDIDLIPMHEWVADEKLSPVVTDFFRRVSKN